MKTVSTFLAIAAFFVLSSSLVSAADKPAQERKDPTQDLVTELVKKGFNTLLAAITKTDLPDKFGTGEYTILGPTDNAFRDLPKAQLDALLADKEKLTALLSSHIIEGKVSYADLKKAKLTTLAGTTLEPALVDGKVKIKTATVVKPDVAATNGVIHGIDKVLLP